MLEMRQKMLKVWNKYDMPEVIRKKILNVFANMGHIIVERHGQIAILEELKDDNSRDSSKSSGT